MFIDVDPEDINFSLNMSGMAVSSSDDESDDGEPGHALKENRKHIVYQSCIATLVKLVNIIVFKKLD